MTNQTIDKSKQCPILRRKECLFKECEDCETQQAYDAGKEDGYSEKRQPMRS